MEGGRDGSDKVQLSSFSSHVIEGDRERHETHRLPCDDVGSLARQRLSEEGEKLVRSRVQRHPVTEEVRREEEEVVLLLLVGVGREDGSGGGDDEVGESRVGKSARTVEVGVEERLAVLTSLEIEPRFGLRSGVDGVLRHVVAVEAEERKSQFR
jgi:hypothetical protein